MSDVSLRVGAAKLVITPPPGHELAGYARRVSPATGTNDELHCRVVTFDDGATTLVLAVCDLLYPSRALTGLVRERIRAALRIPAHQVMLCATHTHCGPGDLASPDGAALQAAVADRIRDATLAAVSAAVPARLVTASRSVPGIGALRRSAAGPADDVATVLAAYPARDPREPIATIVNFACHATVLEHDTSAYSADFPGATCDALESLCGGLGVYLQGCAGDVNPVYTRHDWAECTRIGRMLGAAGAQAALDGLGLLLGPRTINPSWEEELDASARSGAALARPAALRADHRTVEVTEVRPHDLPAGPAAASPRLRAAHRSMRWVQDLRAQGNLFGCFDLPAESLDVQRFRLAENLDIVALPGEPFLATARAIRTDHDGVLLVAGYANQSPGYLPTSEAFAQPGYEVGCSQYGPGTAEALTAAARQLLSPG